MFAGQGAEALLLFMWLACAELDPTVTVGEYGAVARVTWETSEPGTSRVEFGLSEDLGEVTPRGDTLVTTHEVLVAGLAPTTEYYAIAVSETADGRRLESREFTFETRSPDPDIATINVELQLDTAAPSPMILTTVSQQSGVVIVDPNGRLVWWRDLPKSLVVAQAQLTADGTEVVFNVADATHVDPELSAIHRLTLDGATETITKTPAGHHDFVLLEDGNYAVIKADMRQYDAGSDGTLDTVAGDAIIEVAPDGTVIREVWNAWNDLPVTVTEETSTRFYPGALDWIHLNGLWATEDAYYASSHALSTIFKIDRATGELVWRLGERAGDFTFEEGSVGFSDQHAPRWVDGKLVLFNNRDCAIADAYSYGVEYELDEVQMTARETRRHEGTADFCSQVLGNVDVLEDGNWLVNWGTGGTAEEVDPDGEAVRRLTTGIGFPIGNAHYTAPLGGPIAQ